MGRDVGVCGKGVVFSLGRVFGGDRGVLRRDFCCWRILFVYRRFAMVLEKV